MNKMTKLSLTLLSAFVISACSSGGNTPSTGNAGHQEPNSGMSQSGSGSVESGSGSAQSGSGSAQSGSGSAQSGSGSAQSGSGSAQSGSGSAQSGSGPAQSGSGSAQSGSGSAQSGSGSAQSGSGSTHTDTNLSPNTKPELTEDQKTIETFKVRDINGALIPYDGATKLAIEGKKIQLISMKDSFEITKQEIRDLRDIDGKLIGYYGYAMANIQQGNTAEPDAFNREFYPLLYIDDSLKTTPSDKIKTNINYIGSMFYSPKNIPEQKFVADVEGFYFEDTKQIALSIQDRDKKAGLIGNLSLQDITKPENERFKISLIEGDRENIIGKLYDENAKEKATFIGGIFGKQGEILIGTAESIPGKNDQDWKGSIGAVDRIHPLYKTKNN